MHLRSKKTKKGTKNIYSILYVGLWNILLLLLALSLSEKRHSAAVHIKRKWNHSELRDKFTRTLLIKYVY